MRTSGIPGYSTRRRLAALFAVLLMGVIAQPVLAEMIQGEIAHKEVLPPVPTTLQAGADINALGSETVRVQWFPVPEWMAGTWQKAGDQETFQKDFVSGREQKVNFWLNNRVSLSFGHQVDARNTIWHAELLPFRADGERSGSRDRRYVIDMACNRSSPDFVSLRFRTAVVSLDGKGRVAGSRQQEELVNFTPFAADQMNTSSSTKTFTERGQPLYLSDSHTTRQRTEKFKLVDSINGVDLKTSLADFLQNANMSDRIPPDVR